MAAAGAVSRETKNFEKCTVQFNHRHPTVVAPPSARFRSEGLAPGYVRATQRGVRREPSPGARGQQARETANFSYAAK
jgi:hypothetical protein